MAFNCLTGSMWICVSNLARVLTNTVSSVEKDVAQNGQAVRDYHFNSLYGIAASLSTIGAVHNVSGPRLSIIQKVLTGTLGTSTDITE